MKVKEFTDQMPDLELCRIDGDRWCVVFFSHADNNYQISAELDSGDALIVIQELISRYGIHPDVLAAMQKPDVPFDTTLPDGTRAILGNPANPKQAEPPEPLCENCGHTKGGHFFKDENGFCCDCKKYEPPGRP